MKIDLYSTRAVIRAQQVLTVGLVGVPVRFSFSEQWKCLSKVVVFRQGEVTVDVLLPGNLAVMPWEVLQEPGVPVQIGVYGMDVDGKVVIPTVWAVTEPVRPSADPNAGENLEPTSPLWQQIMTLIGSPDQLDTKQKQTLVQAINEANRAVHLVTVTGQSVQNAGEGLLDALEAGKMALCHWEQEDVYLPLTHWVSDRDMTFSAILRGVEYFVNIDPLKSRVYRCAQATFGGGGVYVGTQEPEDDAIILWVDPENDTPSDVARVLYVTVTEQEGVLTADHYFDDIAAALDQGYVVYCRYGTGTYGLLGKVGHQVVFGRLSGATNTQIRIGRNVAATASVVVDTNSFIPVPDTATVGQVMAVKSVDSNTGKPDEWEPVDMTGGATQDDIQRAVDAYMAENPVEVQEGIPVPTTASVGQTIVVKSIDETGKPTEWEPVDMASNKEWEYYGEFTVTEDVNAIACAEEEFVAKQYREVLLHINIVPHSTSATAHLAIAVNNPSGGVGARFKDSLSTTANTTYLVHMERMGPMYSQVTVGGCGTYAEAKGTKYTIVQQTSPYNDTPYIVSWAIANAIGAGSTVEIWGR